MELGQLRHFESTQKLAEQFLRHRLQEAEKTADSLTTMFPGAVNDVVADTLLRGTIWDFVVRYSKNYSGRYVRTFSFGSIPLEPSDYFSESAKWYISERNGQVYLMYKVSGERINPREHLYWAGIRLSGNVVLLHNLRNASGASGHVLYWKGKELVRSLGVDEGIDVVAEQVSQTQAPYFPKDSNEFAGDIHPIKIGQFGLTKDLWLSSVLLAESKISWGESFKETVWVGIQVVLVLALFMAIVLRFLITKYLSRLLSYAESIKAGNLSIQYKKGVVRDFNEIGEAIEEVVHHVASQGRYIADMIEAAESPIIAWSQDGTVTKINRAASRLLQNALGLSRIQNIFDIIDEIQSPETHDAVVKALTGEAVPELEMQIGQGTNLCYVIWSVAPLKDEHNLIIGAIAQGQDITKRRLAEKRLHLSNRVFESTAEAILITDAQGTIIDVNTAFCDITGYSREDILGENPRVMKSGMHSDEFYKVMWGTLQANGVWRGEIWDKRKTGEVYPKFLSVNAVRDEEGQIENYVGVFSDISRKKEDEARLEQLAHFDALTELPNRILFQDRLHTSLARARRKNQNMAVLFVDLDKFKQVNDSLGHRIGDKLLKEVAKRLQDSVREIDTVARLSGDEFTLILTDFHDQEGLEIVASRIVNSVAAAYKLEGHELFVSASVGIAVYPTDGRTSAQLLRNADVAMYHAKEKGRNNFQFFNERMNEHTQMQLSLANSMRSALNKGHIEPHFQMKVDLNKAKPIGVEALARWIDPVEGPVSPGKFIPVAEEHGLIISLGREIFRKCCVQARMWKDMNFDFGRIAINLSAQQFRDKNLIASFEEAMQDHRLDGTSFEIEVTENMMMEDVEEGIHILHALKDLGMKISIDDFGTGYSSLSYLKRFPVDGLKIDRSFVRDVIEDKDDAAIISTIILMTQKLGIEVVAEGVETKEQVALLKQAGCSVIQGFYFATPNRGGEIPIKWADLFDKMQGEIQQIS